MTFTRTYLEWKADWPKDDHSAMVFCDWCDESGHHPDRTGNWRQWIRFGGVYSFEGELHRLSDAESCLIENKRGRSK